MNLLGSAQSLLAGVLALARTRLELFSTELQEELIAAWSMRRLASDRPRLLAASLAELQRDHDAVRS